MQKTPVTLRVLCRDGVHRTATMYKHSRWVGKEGLRKADAYIRYGHKTIQGQIVEYWGGVAFVERIQEGNYTEDADN